MSDIKVGLSKDKALVVATITTGITVEYTRFCSSGSWEREVNRICLELRDELLAFKQGVK